MRFTPDDFQHVPYTGQDDLFEWADEGMDDALLFIRNDYGEWFVRTTRNENLSGFTSAAHDWHRVVGSSDTESGISDLFAALAGRDAMTTESPETVLGARESDEQRPDALAPQTIPVDPFSDDAPIVAACDLANPESCESCQ